MIADVVFVIWVCASGFLGWRRRVTFELFSILTISFAYFIAWFLLKIAQPYLVSSYGDLYITAYFTVWMGCFLFLLLPFGMLQSVLQREKPIQGIRVQIDSHGAPKIPRHSLKRVFSALLGLVWGSLFFLYFLSLAIPLVPVYFAKKGSIVGIVHTESKSLKAVHLFHPMLRKMNQVTQGLRSLRNHSFGRHSLFVPRDRSALLSLKKDTSLLTTANSRLYGKRCSSLMLWKVEYQRIFTNKILVKDLISLSKTHPSSYDKTFSNQPLGSMF